MSGGISFCSGFEQVPLFFSNIVTYDGGDPSQIRLQQPVSTTQANVYIEEITCDSEENTGVHTMEIVSYLAIEHDGNHKIRATAQAPNVGTQHNNLEVRPGEGVDCGGPADVDDNPGWDWSNTAGQTGVYQAGAVGNQRPVNGAGSSSDTCFTAIQNSLDDINTICCAEKGACPGGKNGVGSGAGFPTSCSSDCAALWVPIWNVCSSYITSLFAATPEMASSVAPFSEACDATVYGDTCTASFFTEGMQSFDEGGVRKSDVCAFCVCSLANAPSMAQTVASATSAPQPVLVTAALEARRSALRSAAR